MTAQCVTARRPRQGGNVWEKAGVNISVVYGSMPPEAYRAATGVKSEVKKAVRKRHGVVQSFYSDKTLLHIEDDSRATTMPLHPCDIIVGTSIH